MSYAHTSHAPLPRDPYAGLPELPTFELTSTDIVQGGTAPASMLSALFGVPGGEDRSPQLAWSGFPEETKSFVITCYDPDAPTPSGFWHWCMSNIPAHVTELAADANSAELPEGTLVHRNDASAPGFVGCAPPAGHGPHRYIFTVTAVDVPALELTDEATPAVVSFNLFGHGIARAQLTVTYEEPAA
ncbi:MAG: YbhB/YbcL family Raf kinase inhibitor-like protein [Rothia sp. (in: high G+C Gram-positive bacteria)]|uniref:YbhB/YbcL family Raf kinase inhibitor-like protein n=1 Tax=Rothia sp. (in: high G+C Gram-positive bacteria) TaxID=1885016 RepID=UPI0026DF24C9|nr:YbhB/YbcL family Raf kinase inhibitor-like protein [Rothia sp. (in: high G+C Gram-positive bacteria)]MDO5749658.1 YbhB/YbcL family Raf kinase inhibitor-like protein [Rothia sp. (in: high G+C Gram-positive bacteria)]